MRAPTAANFPDDPFPCFATAKRGALNSAQLVSPPQNRSGWRVWSHI